MNNADDTTVGGDTPNMPSQLKMPITIIPPQAVTAEALQRVRGLSNLGNTCFFNAVMQCLGQTPFLTTIFKNKVVLPGGEFKSKTLSSVTVDYSYAENIIHLFKDILEELQKSGGVYNPRKFFDSFTTQYSQFGGGDQHDSHELLRHLLDSVIVAERVTYKKLLSRNRFEGRKYKDMNEEEKQIFEFYANQAKDRFLIGRVFQGSLESTLKCEDCAHTSPSSEKFLDISLPINVNLSTGKPTIVPPYMRQKSSPESAPQSKRQVKQEKRKNKRDKNFSSRSDKVNSTKAKSSDVSDNTDSENENMDNAETKNDSDTDQLFNNMELSLGISGRGRSELLKKLSPVGLPDAHGTNTSVDNDNEHELKNSTSSDVNTQITPQLVQPPRDVKLNSSITIGLPYIARDDECSIQSCLNSFTAIELLSGNNKVGCEACTKRMHGENGKTINTNATKQFLISSLPAVLILHLKRFQIGLRHTFHKLSSDVTFPLILDVGPFCAATPAIDKRYRTVNSNQKKILYSLYGVVEHSGNMHGGHYVAFVKVRPKVQDDDPRWKFVSKLYNERTDSINNGITAEHDENGYDSDDSIPPDPDAPVPPPSGKWYHVSDSRVSEVTEEHVQKAQAYLLFYERIF